MPLLGQVLNEHLLYGISIARLEPLVSRWLTVARVMTNAALFEHILISESSVIIFLTRDTSARSVCVEEGGRNTHKEAALAP